MNAHTFKRGQKVLVGLAEGVIVRYAGIRKTGGLFDVPMAHYVVRYKSMFSGAWKTETVARDLLTKR